MEIKFISASKKEITTIEQIMNTVGSEYDSDIFVADNREFIEEHLNPQKGFILIALCDNVPAGFMIVRFPDEDNLGKDIHLPKEDLSKVAHMESTAVLKKYRGHKIQKNFLIKAEECLAKTPYKFLMATVSPNNKYSLKNFQDNGYKIMLTKEKYSGVIRHILLKIMNNSDKFF